MPKDTNSIGNNKAPVCESRGFVHKKKEGVHFDTTPLDLFIPNRSLEIFSSQKSDYSRLSVTIAFVC